MNRPLRRVMCVEDDADIRGILEFCLVHVGEFDCLACADGDEALGQVAAFAPDLIVLDVMMPGLSGPETLVRLRELPGLARVPVIFLTAKAMPGEVLALQEHGAMGVVLKPFDPLTFPDQLRAFWRRAQEDGGPDGAAPVGAGHVGT